jgi:tetratricopeptide (TPR) repeat protein
MKKSIHSISLMGVYLLFLVILPQYSAAQALRIPEGKNFTCNAGRRVGVTDIQVKWNAPGVKGREGKIWGTDVAYYGFQVLGFGSDVESPWRAGADESTVISFSTDVTINGKNLQAGKYGFFIALYPDSCVLIFNKNVDGWGSYFYQSGLDVLRVTTIQQKSQPNLQERLAYNFYNQTENSIEIALEWEHWKIPFTVGIDAQSTILKDIKTQMTGALGFDPPSMEQAAQWCLNQNVYLDGALQWINTATDPKFVGTASFKALSLKAGILELQGKTTEAASIMDKAIENGNVLELHAYGRQLLGRKKAKEAMAVFEKNYQKHKGAWPTNAGLMRGYSAMGDLKSALKYAKFAVEQAPDAQNKDFLKRMVEQLEQGKPLD